jgi:glucosamine--fructose-6-phosphate aminotransferase (isomerizing)
MNTHEEKYSNFSIVREMLETAEVVRDFDRTSADRLSVASERVLLTGEGSSRLFPANRVRSLGLRKGWPQSWIVEGALQAREYDLRGAHAFVASNSGKTAEGVELIDHLRSAKSAGIAGVTALVGNADSPIAKGADEHFLLRCGMEDAVAATKSVVEQTLFYETLFRRLAGSPPLDYPALADAITEVLTAGVDSLIVDRIALAPAVYFAGRSDGVAMELALKTNEITRRPSHYLEGTYAVHGVEEVMQPNEAVVLIEPYEDQEEKFRTVLEEGVGMSVIAVSSRQTSFPTIRIPDLGELAPYLQLAAGWSLLVEVGIKLGINIDTPERARKVGNEFIGL